MPRTRSLAWAELRIGLVAIAGVVITAASIVLLTGDRGFFWQRYSLKSRFTNVAGLRPGSPVRLAGYDVGTVTALDFVGDEIEVTFEVNRSRQAQITDRSTAFLGSVSLLGESAVDITASGGGTPIPEWGYIPAGQARGQIADVAEQAGEGIEAITALVQDLRAGRGTVGRLMTDEGLYNELQRFTTAAGDLTSGLREGRGTIGQLLNDPQAAEALEASLANIETLTTRLNAGEGSLGRLLRDDAFYQSLNGAIASLDSVVSRLNRGEGTMGRLLTDDTLVNQITSVTGRLDQMTASLNAGEGTAGRLLKDQELYENMNATVQELQALVADIRRDPRKYLSVRVSIF